LTRLFRPPVLSTDELTAKARNFYFVATGVTGTVVLLLIVMILREPDTAVRRGNSALFLVGLSLALLELNRRGRTALAGALFVIGYLINLTFRVATSGGVNATGMQLYLVIVLMAGVLLGTRGGAITAGAAAVIGFAFAVAKEHGVLPPSQLTFTPFVQWLYSCMTLGMAVVLQRQVSVMLRDALERSNADLRARKDVEQQLRLALDAGNIKIWSQDPKTKRFAADAKLFAMYGVTPDHDGRISFETWIERIHPDDRARAAEANDELHRSAEPTRVEFRIQAPDGTLRHIEGAGAARLDSSGQLAQLVGVNLEVTERKRAEQERAELLQGLRERVKELRLLHATARLVLEDLSDDELMRRLVALMPEAWQFPECCEVRIVLGDDVVATPGYRDSAWKQSTSFKASGRQGTLDVVYLEPRPDADEGPFLREERALLQSLAEMLVSQIELRRHQTHLEELVATRTRELLVAKDGAEQASRAKSTFLATMSHEIRTPMNAILGYAQLLQRDPSLGPDQRQRVGVIFSSGDHLLTLLNDVLHMSRIEAGRVELIDKVFDLHALLEATRLMFAGAARDKQLELRLDVAADVPRALRGDAGKVRQVLINLVGNALKFTDHGHIVIHATAAPTVDGASTLALSVEDTGVGITAPDLERIFEAFEQSRIGVQAGGAGLGLAIGRELARLMGGDLTATSRAGAGSTFHFTFRAQMAQAEALDEAQAAVVGLTPGTRKPKILVVDDHADNRAVLRDLLETIGYQVRLGASGEQAIAEHDAWQPELVLMDLMMPGIGGVEAIRRLRAAGATTLLVALTASSADEGGTEAIVAGANAVWWKPYREADLLERIRALLGVSYVHKDLARKVSVTSLGPPRETGEALALHLRTVPIALREKLRDAALRARLSNARSAADELAQHSEDAAALVRDMLAAYRYDVIVAAVDSTRH
jgi:two-component system sensor histidine kinase/response regulator